MHLHLPARSRAFYFVELRLHGASRRTRTPSARLKAWYASRYAMEALASSANCHRARPRHANKKPRGFWPRGFITFLFWTSYVMSPGRSLRLLTTVTITTAPRNILESSGRNHSATSPIQRIILGFLRQGLFFLVSARTDCSS